MVLDLSMLSSKIRRLLQDLFVSQEVVPTKLKIFFLYLIFIILLVTLDMIFQEVIPQNLGRKQYWNLSKKGEKYDLVIMGNSRTLSGIIPDTLAKYADLNRVINLSMEGVGYAEQYLIIKRFVNNNTVKRIILGTDVYTFMGSGYLKKPFNEYYYLPLIWGSDFYEVLKDLYPYKAIIWKYVPFWKFAEFNREIGLKAFLGSYKNNESSIHDSLNGAFINSGWISDDLVHDFNLLCERKPDFNKLKFPKAVAPWMHEKKIDPTEKKYFLKIVDLCRRKSIKLILVDVPDYYLARNLNLNFTEDDLIISEVVNNKDVIQLSDFDSTFYRDRSNFANATHLHTLTGGVKLSKIIGLRIKE